MPLVQFVITLVAVGLLLFLVNKYVPMEERIKSIMNAVVVIAVVVWILKLFGLLTGLSSVTVGP